MSRQDKMIVTLAMLLLLSGLLACGGNGSSGGSASKPPQEETSMLPAAATSGSQGFLDFLTSLQGEQGDTGLALGLGDSVLPTDDQSAPISLQ